MKQDMKEEQEGEQDRYELRVMLCDINIQTRCILAIFSKNMFFFSFIWRSFLILYGEGFIRNGMTNIRLFEQLFWIITIAFMTVAYCVFPGKMLISGTFPNNSAMGTCLFLPMDDQISTDNTKIDGVVFASGFNMIMFVMYLYLKSKRLLKSKTSLVGRFRRNAVDYKEAALMSVAWSFFPILEIVLNFVFRYLNITSPALFKATQFMWVFMFEIVFLAFTSKIGFQEMPFESVPSRNIPFYVSSPLVLIPRRPCTALIPLLLPLVRSKGVRRSPDPQNTFLSPTVRSRGRGTPMSSGSALAVSSQHTRGRSSQHMSALPDVD